MGYLNVLYFSVSLLSMLEMLKGVSITAF